jgi:hypothetical protein
MAFGAANLKPLTGWPTFAVLTKGCTRAAGIRAFHPAAEDFIVPTFTKSVKVGQPPGLQGSNTSTLIVVQWAVASHPPIRSLSVQPTLTAIV